MAFGPSKGFGALGGTKGAAVEPLTPAFDVVPATWLSTWVTQVDALTRKSWQVRFRASLRTCQPTFTRRWQSHRLARLRRGLPLI